MVFLDPPYAMKSSYQEAVDILLKKGLLTKDGAVLLEYEGEIDIDASPFGFVRDYRYGKTKVRLLRDLL